MAFVTSDITTTQELISSDVEQSLLASSFHQSAPIQEIIPCFQEQGSYWNTSSLENWEEVNPY